MKQWKYPSMEQWKYPNRLPRRKYWYHGTTYENAKMIMRDGVIKPSWYAVWLTCEKWASNFAQFNTQRALGQKVLAKQDYDIRDYQECVVFKIPTASLDYKKMNLSYDHNPDFYRGMVALEYHGEISVELKPDIWEVNSSLLEIKTPETA